MPKAVGKKDHPDLTEVEKWTIIAWGMQYEQVDKGRLVDGSLEKISTRFNICKRTVKNLFQDYRKQLAEGAIYPKLTPQSRLNCGVTIALTDEMRENIVDLHFMTEGSSPIELFVEQYDSEFSQKISRSAMERYLLDIGACSKVVYLAPALTLKHKISMLLPVLAV